MAYDAAGNLTTDTYSGSGVTRVYDADNRMVAETQTAGFVAGAYTYNAEGQRVRRNVGATDVAGRLLYYSPATLYYSHQ